MKRLLIPFAFFLVSMPVKADIHHTISKSTSLKVNAAATASERIGSSFSISGSGVDVTDGTTAGTLSAGTITSGIYNPGTIAVTQNATSGEAFSFSTSFVQGDVVPTSAPSVGAVPNFSDVTSTAAGTAGSLAGTITDTAVTIVAGGAGTEAVGQIINEIIVK
tara:strand:- start:356 stop:844 length:489 start_codon:yes stop_codon:yes gene_type:complete